MLLYTHLELLQTLARVDVSILVKPAGLLFVHWDFKRRFWGREEGQQDRAA